MEKVKNDAVNLVNCFVPYTIRTDFAIQCAIMCINERIKDLDIPFSETDNKRHLYLLDLKEEVLKL